LVRDQYHAKILHTISKISGGEKSHINFGVICNSNNICFKTEFQFKTFEKTIKGENTKIEHNCTQNLGTEKNVGIRGIPKLKEKSEGLKIAFYPYWKEYVIEIHSRLYFFIFLTSPTQPFSSSGGGNNHWQLKDTFLQLNVNQYFTSQLDIK
jgi:hypothetical protein